MDYKTALASVIERITDMTPNRDPGIRFRHDTDGILDDLPDDRMFVITPLTLNWFATPATGNAVSADVNVSVRYSRSADWVSMRNAAEDMEQLFSWLSYLPGQEWKAGLTAEVIDAAVSTNDGIRVSLTLRLAWTSG